jgi:hypothetical protein
MNTTFLSYLLFLILGTILIAYLYQIMNKGNKIVSPIKENMMPVILDTCPNERVGAMPVHRVGPIINFHESFNKYNSNLKAGPPTGIPEMGWRNFYLSNFNTNKVKNDDSFSGTVVRNYLDNLENVKNIYREC